MRSSRWLYLRSVHAIAAGGSHVTTKLVSLSATRVGLATTPEGRVSGEGEGEGAREVRVKGER